MEFDGVRFHIDRDTIAHHSFSDVTSRHELHAFKLVVPLDAPLMVEDARGVCGEVRAPVLVSPHVAQRMGCEGRTLALCWEPETRAGLELGVHWSSGMHVLEGSRARGLVELARGASELVGEPGAVGDVMREAARALTRGDASSRALDRRIVEVLEELRRDPSGAMDRAGAARIAGVSVSRFSHLFREQVGASFQSYRLWVRMRCAVEALVAGGDITRAALDAGFSDHAHLTRTMRRFTGQPPSYLRG